MSANRIKVLPGQVTAGFLKDFGAEKMRMNLKVPFAEKDEAKMLGARWDAARKIWYVEGKADMAAFARWAPTPHDGSTIVVPRQSGMQANKREASSKVIVGSAYVAQQRVCECLPWEVCDKCESTALSR